MWFIYNACWKLSPLVNDIAEYMFTQICVAMLRHLATMSV